MANWTPYAINYNPLAAGSIDGTDTEPHDHAVVRAMDANYVPADINVKPEHTLFIGRLPHNFGEGKLEEKFCRFGRLDGVCVVRDVVTGQSKGYGFVTFHRKSDAVEAWRECQKLEIEGYRVIVEKEAGHTMKGWVPRRLGGGFGGRKEAGQLRFGCSDRPWRKPIILPHQPSLDPTSARLPEQDVKTPTRGRDQFKSSCDSESFQQQHHQYDSDQYRDNQGNHYDSGRRKERREYNSHKFERRSSHHHRRNEREGGYRDNTRDTDYSRQQEKDHNFGKHRKDRKGSDSHSRHRDRDCD